MSSNKVYVVPLNNYLKMMATHSVARRLEEVVDEPLLYSLIGAAIESRKPDENVLEVLKRVDLTRVMKGSEELNQPFECSFFAGRTAWIYQDDNEYFRYYSRKNTGIYSFDIIDLLSVFRNEKKKEVFAFIQENWNIKGLNAWHMEQVEKYRSNQWILQGIQDDAPHYPYLNKLIKKHWVVLEKLNEFATEKITGKKLAVDGEAIFFLSNNHLKDTYLPKYSPSTINNLVNLFCVLGFLKKVPFESIPKALSDKAVVQYKRKKVRNHTSYYQLADFQDAYQEAEKRAEQLIVNKIYYHRLSRKVVTDLFGESFANEIYVQRTYGNKAKSEPIYIKGQDTFYTESERLENNFLQQLRDTGKCAKYELAQTSLLSRHRFDKAWEFLIQKYQCNEKLPTKEEMKKYEMKKRLLIAIPVQENRAS